MVFASVLLQSEVTSHPASCPSQGRVIEGNVSPIGQFLENDSDQRSTAALGVNITVS